MLRTFRPWAVPLVALAVLALILVPIGVWHRPATDGIYQGFDPNLIYISQKGDYSSEGTVQVSTDSLTLWAVPDSNPTVHLISSELDYRVAMDIRILEEQPGTTPFRIEMWSPRKEASYSLSFGPAPEHLVTSEAVVKKTVIKNETLGTYVPGMPYHVEMSLDKEEGVILSRLSGGESPPSGSNMLMLVGGPDQPSYREVHSEHIPVEEGEAYVFGGVLKRVRGNGWYKLVLEWLDSKGARLSSADDWRPPTDLNGWTAREITATAPRRAASARLVLGAGSGSSVYLIADLFLSKASEQGVNLLPNGGLAKQSEGWRLVGSAVPAEERPNILAAGAIGVESAVSASEAPTLFLDLPIALSVSASSTGGLSGAAVENYSLILPAQVWSAMNVEDARSTGLVLVLLVIGSIMALAASVPWASRRMRRGVALWRSGQLQMWLNKPVALRHWPLLLGVGGAVAAFLVLNSFLFNLGYHPYDFISNKVWAYIAARYGVTEIYPLSNVATPAAAAWGGTPYGPGIFPYEPVMAYVSGATGWIYRLFLAGPEGLSVNDFQLGFVIKSVNILFCLADAGLIYLILRGLNISQRSSLVGAALFLFNPAVWFAMSIWGTTQTVSIFFLLLSIWLAGKRLPLWAWLALALTALTRPQLLVPGFLLGLAFFRMFSIRENIYAISWSIILVFLVLAPFSLGLSPSFTIDILLEDLHAQNPVVPEVGEYFHASLGALNIWPLISPFTEGLSGMSRFFFPSTTPLVGQFTYVEMGNMLVFGVLLATGMLILLHRRPAMSGGVYLPLVATGMLSLLLLRTGMANHHFVLVLPLVVLCRKCLNGSAYYIIVAILTATTLVSIYGDLGIGISQVGYLMPALAYENNPITWFFMQLLRADRFITLGSFANMAVLVWLGVAATQRMLGTTVMGRPGGASGS